MDATTSRLRDCERQESLSLDCHGGNSRLAVTQAAYVRADEVTPEGIFAGSCCESAPRIASGKSVLPRRRRRARHSGVVV